MKFLTRILLYVNVLSTVLAPAARGQERAGDATWGFVTLRYDPESPASIYTGYGWRRAFAMGGVAHNPRTGYAELVGGVGAVIRVRRSEHWIAVATGGTGTGSFRQLYWLPTVRTRSLTTRAQVKWTLASGAAAQKLSISPVSVTLPLIRRVSGGAAVDLSAAEHARTRIGAGPEVRVRLPGAVLGVDALRAVKGDASRVRFFFTTLF